MCVVIAFTSCAGGVSCKITVRSDLLSYNEENGFVPKIGIREGLRKFAEWYGEYEHLCT